MLLLSCQLPFLDEKPNKAQLIPSETKDYRALLDNMASGELNMLPGLNSVSDDDFRYDPKSLPSLLEVEQNTYLWKADLFGINDNREWTRPYRVIFIANVVLEGLASRSLEAEVEQLRGEAYFHRAIAFYHLLQQFSLPYQSQTAQTSLGLPIRTTANVNVIEKRASLQASYDQVFSDLAQAASRLPEYPEYKQRPSRWAVEALRARIYLSMQQYSQALEHASACLAMKAPLLEYKTLDTKARFSMPVWQENPEIIFYSYLQPYSYNSSVLTKVDSLLYRSYQVNDLRRDVFFTADRVYKGSYVGHSTPFGGLAVDEVYLIQAECLARLNQNQESILALNSLLKTRFANFEPYEENADVLSLVLMERRKQLIARGLRWSDLRRLNLDPKYAKTLERTDKNGVRYVLLPNDKRYTFPIPENEVKASGIEQNPR